MLTGDRIHRIEAIWPGSLNYIFNNLSADLPLSEADRIAKLIPGLKLGHIFGEDEKSKSKVKSLRNEDFANVEILRSISEGEGPARQGARTGRVSAGR